MINGFVKMISLMLNLGLCLLILCLPVEALRKLDESLGISSGSTLFVKAKQILRQNNTIFL